MLRVKRRKTSGPSIDDEDAIWQFVYENLCETNLYEDAEEPLFRQYLQENPDKKWTIVEFMDYFTNSMRPTLYKCDLPPQVVLHLYQRLDLEISPHVEMILENKFRATLRLDADRRLHSFTLFSGSQKSPEDVRRRKQTIPEVTEAFDRKMWAYIFANYDRLNMRVLMSAEFWQEVIDDEPEMPLQSAKMLMHHFCSRMLEKLHMQRVAVEKRLGIYQMMDLRMTREAREWFLKKDGVRVQLDFQGYVTGWEEEKEEEPKDQSLIQRQTAPNLRNISTWQPRNVPSTFNFNSAPAAAAANSDSDDQFQDAQYESPSRAESYANAPKRRVQFTDEDRLNVWNYVYAKFRTAHTMENPVLPKGLAFWNEYVRKTMSSKTAANWSSHFRKKMCPTLYEMRMPREKILYLYQHIEINISDRIRAILEKKCQAKLRLGHNGQLINWKFLDESRGAESDQENEEDPDLEEDPDSTLPMETDSDEELNRLMNSSDEEEEPPKTRSGGSSSKRRSRRRSAMPAIFVDDQGEEMTPRGKAAEDQEHREKTLRTAIALRQQDMEEREERMRAPEVSPSKKTPEDYSQDVPESVFDEDQLPESLDPFMESSEADVVEASIEEEKGQLMQELLEAGEDELDEFITLPRLMKIIEKTMEETEDDDAIDEINAVIGTAFEKKNWDEEGVLVSALYNKFTTIIRTDSSGALQAAFLKRADGWLRKILTNIPNRGVFEMLAEQLCASLKEELKKFAENENEPSTSS